jgi:damage-control phosphatase, subfamily I
MKMYLECIPCIIKQAYNTAQRATDDKGKIREILDKTSEYVKTLNLDQTPADACNYVYKITKEITGKNDPYKEEKDKYNQICLEMLPAIEKKIYESDEPIHAAIKASIFGNLIDLGIGLKFDLEKDSETIFKKELAADDYKMFMKEISKGRKNILFLGDNAGEIVFDKPLVQILSKDHNLIYVIKSGPIINDSTMDDAKAVGMTKIVEVIETGSDGIGVKWDSVSEEFFKKYNEADIIMSKGQGNFETMDKKKGNIYFMLRAKCESVAKELGVNFGEIVFKNQKNS